MAGAEGIRNETAVQQKKAGFTRFEKSFHGKIKEKI